MKEKENRIASFIESISYDDSLNISEENCLARGASKIRNAGQCFNTGDTCNFSMNTLTCYNSGKCLGAANILTCTGRVPENPNCLCPNSTLSCTIVG